MQRQVKRRMEKAEKIKKKPETYNPIPTKWLAAGAAAMCAIVLASLAITIWQSVDRVVARIGGTEIRASEMGPARLFVGQFDMPEEEDENALREAAAVRMAAFALVREKALELGVAMTADEIAAIRAEYTDAVNFQGFDPSLLFSMGIMNADDYVSFELNNRTRGRVVQAILDDPGMWDEFNVREIVGELMAAQHILIRANDPGASRHPLDPELDEGEEMSDADAYAHRFARAREISEELHGRLLAGESFEELMLEYSDDQDPEGEPVTMTFMPGQMVQEFEDGTRALAIGEISEPVWTAFGYHIIRRAEPVPADAQGSPFDEPVFGVFVERARERVTFAPALYTADLG